LPRYTSDRCWRKPNQRSADLRSRRSKSVPPNRPRSHSTCQQTDPHQLPLLPLYLLTTMHSNVNDRRYQLESALKQLSCDSLQRLKLQNAPLPKRRLWPKNHGREAPLLRHLQSSRSKSKRRYHNLQPSTMLFPLFPPLFQLPMLRLLPRPASSMVRCHHPPFDP